MAHWIDGASEMPENVQAHFRRYLDIEQAWERCHNGLYLIWLARRFASPAGAMDIDRVAGEASNQLRGAVEAYFSRAKVRNPQDALPLAFNHVIADIQVATGKSGPMSGRTRGSGSEYEGYLVEALKVVADLVRARIEPPTVD
jgi:hypothetical protein